MGRSSPGVLLRKNMWLDAVSKRIFLFRESIHCLVKMFSIFAVLDGHRWKLECLYERVFTAPPYMRKCGPSRRQVSCCLSVTYVYCIVSTKLTISSNFFFGLIAPSPTKLPLRSAAAFERRCTFQGHFWSHKLVNKHVVIFRKRYKMRQLQQETNMKLGAYSIKKHHSLKVI